jgi:hypothetical protein
VTSDAAAPGRGGGRRDETDREADGEVVALFRGRSVELRQPPKAGARA